MLIFPTKKCNCHWSLAGFFETHLGLVSEGQRFSTAFFSSAARSRFDCRFLVPTMFCQYFIFSVFCYSQLQKKRATGQERAFWAAMISLKYFYLIKSNSNDKRPGRLSWWYRGFGTNLKLLLNSSTEKKSTFDTNWRKNCLTNFYCHIKMAFIYHVAKQHKNPQLSNLTQRDRSLWVQLK